MIDKFVVNVLKKTSDILTLSLAPKHQDCTGDSPTVSKRARMELTDFFISINKYRLVKH